jgi:hypothetical protein
LKILQLIAKIKLKEKFRNKRNVLADHEAAYVCLKAAAVFSDRITRWAVTAANIAGIRRQNGGSGRPGSNIDKPPMGSKSGVLRVADTECGKRNRKSKKLKK